VIEALTVMAGGAIGTLLRYWVYIWWTASFGQTFPWSTIIVNVVGSFGIGFFARLTMAGGLLPTPPLVQLFVMIGIFGGFTTFSTFSLQTLHLAEAGQWMEAGANVAISLVVCLGGVWLGHMAAVGVNALAAPK